MFLFYIINKENEQEKRVKVEKMYIFRDYVSCMMLL